MEENKDLNLQRQIYQMHKEGYDKIAKAFGESKLLSNAEMVKIKGDPGVEGKPGYTPVLGKDYFTKKDQEQIVKDVLSKVVIPEPIPGKDGKDAVVDDKKLEAFVRQEVAKIKIPQPENGKDAVVDYGSIVNSVLNKLPEIDLTPVKDELKEEIKKYYESYSPRILKSGGPTTRLGDIVDINIEGAEEGSVLKLGSDGYWYAGTNTGDQNLQQVTDNGATTTNDIFANNQVSHRAFAFDPTANDDDSNTAGNGTFAVGDYWLNTTSTALFQVHDVSTGSAVWLQVVKLNEDGELAGVFIPRSDTAAVIDTIVLEDGEIAFTTDTNELRRGDGLTAGGIQVECHFTQKAEETLSGSVSNAVASIVSGGSITDIAGYDFEYTFKITPYKVQNGELKFFDSAESNTATYIGGGSSYNVSVVWDAFSGADGYLVQCKTYLPDISFTFSEYNNGYGITSTNSITILAYNPYTQSDWVNTSNVEVDTSNHTYRGIALESLGGINVNESSYYNNGDFLVGRGQNGDINIGTEALGGLNSINIQTGLSKITSIDYSVLIGHQNNVNSEGGVAIGYGNSGVAVVGVDNDSPIALGLYNGGSGTTIGSGNYAVSNSVVITPYDFNKQEIGSNLATLGEGFFVGKGNSFPTAPHGMALKDGNFGTRVNAPSKAVELNGNTIIEDISTLGSELITNNFLTGGGSGWIYDSAVYSSQGFKGILKDANGTATLTPPNTPTLTAGKRYLLAVEFIGYDFGAGYTSSFGSNISINCGGVLLSNKVGYASTYYFTFTAVNSGVLTFTPTTNSRFYLFNTSLKEITGGDLEVLKNVYIGGTSGISTIQLLANGSGTFAGSLTANSFIKSGGTSSEFLKADGSVDSSTYLTTGTASSTYVPYTGATGNVDLGANDFTVNTDTLFVNSSTGRVGIGTTTPSAKLSVYDNNSNFTKVDIGANPNTVAIIADDVNAVSGMQMGNVNTGTSADFRFLIKDPTGHYFAFSQPGTGNNLQLFGLNRRSTDYIFNAGGTARDLAIGTADEKALILGTNGSERMRITSGGNVGIGNNNPTYKLDVSGNLTDERARFVNTSATGSFGFQVANNIGKGADVGLMYGSSVAGTLSGFNRANSFYIRSFGAGVDRFVLGTGSSAPLHFITSDTARMTVSSDGKVGIGTDSPLRLLEAVGSTIDNGASSFGDAIRMRSLVSNGSAGLQVATPTEYATLVLYGADRGGGLGDQALFNTSTSLRFLTNGNVASGGTEKINFSTGGFANNPTMTITGGNPGNVGIGTTAPDAKLHISDGNTVASGFMSSADDIIISRQENAPGFSFAVASNSNSLHRGVFKAVRSRGTLASPTAVAVNDVTFSLLAAAYDGTAFRATADIDMIVDTTPVNNTSVGQAITFLTGTTTRTERMRITSAGNVGIGTTSPSARLHTLSTTEQLRLGYDTSNYWNATTGSTGITTFNAVGSGSKFVFSDNIELTQTTTTETITPDTTITIIVNGTTYKIPALAV